MASGLVCGVARNPCLPSRKIPRVFWFGKTIENVADSDFLADEKAGARVPRPFREADQVVGREIASERIETLYSTHPQEHESQLPRPKSKKGSAREPSIIFRIQELIPSSTERRIERYAIGVGKGLGYKKLDCSFLRMTNGGDGSWFLVLLARL